MSVQKDEKSNTWFYRKRVKDASGKTVMLRKRGFKTKKEAQIAEAQVEYELESLRRVTMNQLCDEYLKYIENKYKIATIYGKKIVIDKYIRGYFGDKYPQKITNNDVLNWQNAIKRSNVTIGRVNKITGLLKDIYEYADKFYNINYNPVKAVGYIKNTSVVKNIMLIWTPEEFNSFIKCCESDTLQYTLFNLLYYTGMRKGEALALTWEDINRGSKYIRITKTITQKHKENNATYTLTAPKTSKGVRTIDLPQKLLLILNEYRIWQEKSFPGLTEQYFVFGGIKPISETSLERYKNKKCKEAGVKQIRIHDFRHSHASLLINMGITPLFISERLGHQDVSTTLDVYSHLFPTNQQEIVNRLDDMMN